MNIRGLASIAVLGGALMALGCGGSEPDNPFDPGAAGGTGGAGTGGSAGNGGTGGGGMATCDAPACVFCPAEALGEGSIIGDLTVPFEFTAMPDGTVTQGETTNVAIAASAVVSDLPVEVTATISGTSTYDVTSGGTGSAEIEIPEQEVTGTDLALDAGEGTLELTADAEATEAVVQLTSAVFAIVVTAPVPLELNIDASETGACDTIGDGVTLPVEAAQQ